MVVLQLEQQPYLIQAIFTGELEDVRTAVDSKQDVNFLDSEKRSPLHAASFKGDAEIAELLISNGARVNTKDSQWTTPLHRACCCGASELVALLLQNQADTTARDKQWQTPLHVAAANNAYDCVRQLLNCVPNVNVTDRTGRTALHHAAFNGHTDVVELLLSKGCIVNACDKKDCRPIHCAAYTGNVETIDILLRHRADINAKDRNQYTPLHVAASSAMMGACSTLLSSGALVDARNSYGNTPLHIACLNGHLSVCQILISYGADIEATNYRGQSPLHIAAASTHGVDCLNFLVEQQVDINKQSLDGRTPLHMTAIHGRFTRSKTLIDFGAVVDSIDKNNCTALHIAALYGHDLLSNTLLSHGAVSSKKGYLGRTPLHMSCLSGFVECCRKFLQAGVDLNAQDDSGKTPIHCAAYKGSVECLDLLVSNGADFNLVDNIGRIPLHYAAVQGHYPCIFTLVGLGSSVNLCDAEGCSPLHLASAYNLTGNCVEYLLKRKSDPNLKDNKGFTPIHYAVAGENLAGLRHLLSVVGSCYIMHGPDMPSTTPLHLAAKCGNQEILQLLLPYFPDKNIKTEHGSTALLLAARGGRTHCVQILLRCGAKVALSDELYQMTPVHYSAKNGHIHCLALLLDNTEDQNVIDLRDSFHRTALMLSVSGGHLECAHTLLKCGADPNVVDADKHSSLFRAVVNGQHVAVELLMSCGAKAGSSDVHGKTVLHIAAACGRLSSLQMFLKYMQEEEARKLDNQGCSALHWACYNGNPSCVAFLLEQNIFKELIGNIFSPIHCATVLGERNCIELLCRYYGGDSIKLKDARNRTPLHIAALHGPIDCAKFLLEQGVEINCQDSDGRTPLIAAAQNGQSQIIDLLISHKVDVTKYDNNGNTALHVACLKLHSHSALLLLEHIDDPNILNMINNQRKTPLHLSARNGLVNVTRELIRKGSSVLSLDANGMTPALCCAPDSDVAQCLALILANYALCSQQGNNKEISRTTLNACLVRKFKKLKTFSTQMSQTDVSLLHNPDHFKCERMSRLQHLIDRRNSDLQRKYQIEQINADSLKNYGRFDKKGCPLHHSKSHMLLPYKSRHCDIEILKKLMEDRFRKNLKISKKEKYAWNGSKKAHVMLIANNDVLKQDSKSVQSVADVPTARTKTEPSPDLNKNTTALLCEPSCSFSSREKLEEFEEGLVQIKAEVTNEESLNLNRKKWAKPRANKKPFTCTVLKSKVGVLDIQSSTRTNEASLLEREKKFEDDKVMDNVPESTTVEELYVNPKGAANLSSNNSPAVDNDSSPQSDQYSNQDFERLQEFHTKFASEHTDLWKNTDYELYLNLIKEGLETIKAAKNLDFIVNDMHKFDSTLKNWPESLPTAVDIIQHIIAKIAKVQKASEQIAKSEDPCSTKKLTTYHSGSATFIGDFVSNRLGTDTFIIENLGTFDSNSQEPQLFREVLATDYVEKSSGDDGDENSTREVISGTISLVDYKAIQEEMEITANEALINAQSSQENLLTPLDDFEGATKAAEALEDATKAAEAREGATKAAEVLEDATKAAEVSEGEIKASEVSDGESDPAEASTESQAEPLEEKSCEVDLDTAFVEAQDEPSEEDRHCEGEAVQDMVEPQEIVKLDDNKNAPSLENIEEFYEASTEGLKVQQKNSMSCKKKLKDGSCNIS